MNNPSISPEIKAKLKLPFPSHPSIEITIEGEVSEVYDSAQRLGFDERLIFRKLRTFDESDKEYAMGPDGDWYEIARN